MRASKTFGKIAHRLNMQRPPPLKSTPCATSQRAPSTVYSTWKSRLTRGYRRRFRSLPVYQPVSAANIVFNPPACLHYKCLPHVKPVRGCTKGCLRLSERRSDPRQRAIEPLFLPADSAIAGLDLVDRSFDEWSK